jgi:hypothetical protein
MFIHTVVGNYMTIIIVIVSFVIFVFVLCCFIVVVVCVRADCNWSLAIELSN